MTVTVRQWLRRYRMSPLDVPIWFLGLVVAVLWVAPFVWMLSTSFKPVDEVMTTKIRWIPKTWVLDNYRVAFQHPIPRWMFNSLLIAVVATAVGVLLGAMAGYALARLNFPGKGVLFAVVLGSLMIPVELAVVPLYVAFLKVGLVDSYPALILPSIASVVSVYIFRQFFMGLPVEIEEAARIDGANRFEVFFRLALPLARAPMIASTILLFTTNWNAYLWPLLVSFSEQMKTLPVGVGEFSPVSGNYTQVTSYGPAMAAATLLCIPSLAIFLILQKYFVEGVAQTGVKM